MYICVYKGELRLEVGEVRRQDPGLGEEFVLLISIIISSSSSSINIISSIMISSRSSSSSSSCSLVDYKSTNYNF